jgi:hypothetical protein
VDAKEVINSMETDLNMLKILKSVKIFIHEHYQNYGMFNCSKEAKKNIYQFGMKPKIDVSIPNWHDHFILLNDFAKFSPWKEKFEACNWKPTDKLLTEIRLHASSEFERFKKSSEKSSLPEIYDALSKTWQSERWFWTFNHISATFSRYCFRLMNEKFLKLPLTFGFWKNTKEDMFENTPTPITEYDQFLYGIKWNEKTVDFKTYNTNK